MESSVLDQLRLQEGRLFQSESVLALYLDIKAVMNEVLCKSSLEKKEALETLNEDFLSSLESTLKVLGPKGINDYHNQSLNECVKLVARLLWPSEHLLVARPLLTTLFKGLCKRITSSENYPHYHALDPIKQDYVIREAFRRTLVNDCLVVFPSQQDEDLHSVDSCERPIGAQSAIAKKPIEFNTELTPDDEIHESVSVAAKSVAHIVAPIFTEKLNDDAKSVKSLARSLARCEAIAAKPLEEQSVAQRSEAPSVARSVAPSVARSLAKSVAKLQSSLDDVGSVVMIDLPQRSEARSVIGKSIISEMPKVTSAEECKSMRSGYSAVSSATTSTLRKPLNVRKVLLETDEK